MAPGGYFKGCLTILQGNNTGPTHIRNFPQLNEGVLRKNGLEVGTTSYAYAAHEQYRPHCFIYNIEITQCSNQGLLQQNGTCRQDLASMQIDLA